jgi:UDP-glucose 4-epimerase
VKILIAGGAGYEGVPFLITGTDYPTRDGSGLRDYIHIWDLAAAHLAALGRFDALPGPALAINLGTGRGTTVRELLAEFNRAVERPVPAGEAPRRPGPPGPAPCDVASCRAASRS